MWNSGLNPSTPGFSGVLGKITRTGPSRITSKETFEPMAPAAMPGDPIHMAKMAALSGMSDAGTNIAPMPHMAGVGVPHMGNSLSMNQNSQQKDKFLALLRGHP